MPEALAQPVEDFAPPELSEAPKPVDSVDASKAVHMAWASKIDDAPEPPQAPEAVDAGEASKPLESAEASKPADGADPAKPADASKPADAAEDKAEDPHGSWSLKSLDGQSLRVSFAVDPVMDLRAWAMAGHHIESRIVDVGNQLEISQAQRRCMPPRDFERIDLAALERGCSRVAADKSFDRPTLIVQLSFASLGAGRGRATVLPRARELHPILRQAAICELVDVDPGVPLGRLSEVSSLIRSLFRSLWLRVEPTRQSIETAYGAQASGLTVKASQLGVDEASIISGMQAFVQRVKRPNLLLTVTGLPRPELMIEAMSAGFTHATLHSAPPRPPELADQEPRGPVAA